MPLARDHHVVVTVHAQLHGPLELEGGQRGRLREDAGVAFLAAKAAAHAAADHFDVLGAQVQRGSGFALVAVRVLGGDVQGELPILTWHGVGDLPLKVELFLLAAVRASLQAVRRGGNGCVRVATRDALGGHDETALGHGLVDGQDGRQLLDQDLGLLGGFTGVEHVARHHHGHRLAQKLHLAGGEEGIVMDDGAAVVLARDVARREHRHHAVLGQQSLAVDAFPDQLAMGHGRQHQRCVQRAAQFGQVVGVDGLAGDVQHGRLVRESPPLGARPGVALGRQEFLQRGGRVHGGLLADQAAVSRAGWGSCCASCRNRSTRLRATSER